jgi:hypothetical protein
MFIRGQPRNQNMDPWHIYIYIYILFMWDVRVNLRVPRLILTDSKINNQVSLKLLSILAAIKLEREITKEQTL